jgi:hypothetical protein
MTPSTPNDPPTLRQAALIAGLGYLLMPVSIAEFYAMPRLIIPGHIEQTVQNIATHGSLLVTAILCYLVTFILDVVIAWALYILLIPVSRSLSLLTAWFRLIYTALALFALFNLVNVYRIVHTPDFLDAFGSQQIHAQVKLLISSFRYDFSFSLLIFAIHLVLLGCLIYRSGYIPRFIGILLILNGLGWLIDSLSPYLYPTAHLGFVAITFLGELVFMLWLLIRGWKIQQPAD